MLYKKVIKRILDIIVSTIILLFIWPILFIIAIWIRVDSKGPAFFTQIRIGQYGREFRVYKFRSMIQNAQQVGPKSTVPNDKRITKSGKFLRKTSLDELPQIFNILKGDMSFVGPRPTVPEFYNEYDDEQKKAFIVKPGLTGNAQANGRSSLTKEQKRALEIEYVQNISFALDSKIILQTVRKVLLGVQTT